MNTTMTGTSDSRTTAPAGATMDSRAGRVTARRVHVSEWIKLRSLRSTVWAVLAVALGIVLVGAFTAVGIVVRDGPPVAEALAADPSGGVLSGVSFATWAAVAVGVLVVTTEYRTRSILTSVTAVPGRVLLVWAKAGTAAAVVVLVSLPALLVTFLIARTLLATHGGSISLTTPGVGRAIIAASLTLGATTALATGFGWLLRSTAGAVAVLVALLYVLPSSVTLLPRAVGDAILPHLPSNAAAAAMHLTPTDGALAPWAGLAVYAAYTVLALSAAAFAVTRRDA